MLVALVVAAELLAGVLVEQLVAAPVEQLAAAAAAAGLRVAALAVRAGLMHEPAVAASVVAAVSVADVQLAAGWLWVRTWVFPIAFFVDAFEDR